MKGKKERLNEIDSSTLGKEIKKDGKKNREKERRER